MDTPVQVIPSDICSIIDLNRRSTYLALSFTGERVFLYRGTFYRENAYYICEDHCSFWDFLPTNNGTSAVCVTASSGFVKRYRRTIPFDPRENEGLLLSFIEVFDILINMFSKDSLHHAYFIEGEKTAVLATVEAFLQDAFDLKRGGHPDVHFSEYESMGIDESRALQAMQSMRPLLGDRKIFIITVQSITNEAQNSLLKVFEEPTSGTHFFVISPSQRILLPTLRSRMVVLTHSSTDGNAGVGAGEFMKLSYKDRFAFVAPLIEEKDRFKAENLLQGIVSVIDEDKESLDKSKGEILKELLILIRYVKDRSSSLKLILERVTLMDF